MKDDEMKQRTALTMISSRRGAMDALPPIDAVCNHNGIQDTTTSIVSYPKKETTDNNKEQEYTMSHISVSDLNQDSLYKDCVTAPDKDGFHGYSKITAEAGCEQAQNNAEGDDENETVPSSISVIPASYCGYMRRKRAKIRNPVISDTLLDKIPFCLTCQLLTTDPPFQIRNGKSLEKVRQQCTQESENACDRNKFDYICLSGTHLLNVKGEWELADGTKVSEDEENLESEERTSISIKKYYLGKFTCTSQCISGREQWKVALTSERNVVKNRHKNSDPLNGVNNTLAQAIKMNSSNCTMQRSGHESNEKKYPSVVQMLQQAKEEGNELLRVVSNAIHVITPIGANDNAVPSKAVGNEEELFCRVKVATSQIRAHFVSAVKEDDLAKLGDDFKTPRIGTLVRETFCNALANLLKVGFRGTDRSFQFLFGRLSVWSLIKEVGHSMNCQEMERTLRYIGNCKYAKCDDERYRLAIAEFLNKQNQNHEKLIVSLFQAFLKNEEIIQKFYVPGTLWCDQCSSTTNSQIDDLRTHIESISNFPYNLHPNFESCMRKMSNENGESGLSLNCEVTGQREVFCFE